MGNTTLSLKDVINNMMDALQRAQERLKELGEVSPDLPHVTDDMLLVDDMEKSIDECESLYERINSTLVFATYAGKKTVALFRDGQNDPFGFGPDGFEMREKYWDWANEFGAWPADEYYEELQGFFEKKMEGLMEKSAISVPEKSYFDIHVTYGPADSDGYSVFVEFDGLAGEQDAVDKAVEDCLFHEPEDIGKIDYVAEIDEETYFQSTGKEVIYVAIFNCFGDFNKLVDEYSKEYDVTLVNGNTLCFSGLDGQKLSDLMERDGMDYNYSYDSPEEAWNKEKIVEEGISNEKKSPLDSLISKGKEKVQEQSSKQTSRENDKEL